MVMPEPKYVRLPAKNLEEIKRILQNLGESLKSICREGELIKINEILNKLEEDKD